MLEDAYGERKEQLSTLCSQCASVANEAAILLEELAPGLLHTSEMIDAYLDEHAGIAGAKSDEPKWPQLRLPDKTGLFLGEKGNSLFLPNSEEVCALLKQYGQQGITYNKGVPDFAPFCHLKTPWGDVDAQVEIAHMTPNRHNKKWTFGKRSTDESYDPAFDLGNYNQADLALVKKLSSLYPDLLPSQTDFEYKNACTKLCQELNSFRTEAELTWHECPDGKTMQLIPRAIHKACPHVGGVAITQSLQEYADIEKDK